MKYKYILLLLLTSSLLVGCGMTKRKAIFLNNYETTAHIVENETQYSSEQEEETHFIDTTTSSSETTTSENSTEEVTEPSLELPSESSTEKAESPTEISTITQTAPQTETPTEKPMEVPTQKPTVSSGITIEGVKLAKGEVKYTTSAIQTSINGSVNNYTKYKTMYYAKNTSDAELFLNEYINKINAGDFEKFMSVYIYCDDNVSCIENLITSKISIANQYNKISPYRTLKDKDFEKNMMKLNTNLSDFNVDSVELVKAGKCYQIDFTFFLSKEDYNKCISKAKEYANSSSGKDDYEKIYNLCRKFIPLNYSSSENCQSAYGVFFENKAIDDGITKALAMCLSEMGYEYRIEYSSNGTKHPARFILVRLNGKYYYIEPRGLLNGEKDLYNNVLIGKDILKSYYIEMLHKETGDILKAEVNRKYTIYPNFDDSNSCTCAGMLSETSYNTEKIIKAVLAEHYDTEQYSYKIIPQ